MTFSRGERLAVSSPQGRFAAGAALLDGHAMVPASAHGKHLFLHFEHALVLHVHLGLYGAWDFGGDTHVPRRLQHRRAPQGGGAEVGRRGRRCCSPPYAGPPAPVGAVRVRLAGNHGWADLRGATTCEAITEAEAAAVLDRLGPDPLHNAGGSRDDFVRRVLSNGLRSRRC